MLLRNLETPCLIVDFDAFERNVARMDELLENRPMRLRPHYKSFKNLALAHYLSDHGAKGFLTAKLSEAEDLIQAGFEDIVIGNQITAREKIARAAYLAGCCRLTVCVDSEDNILALENACALAGTTLYCLVEYDVGMKRCGVFTEADFIRLAKAVSACPHLRFEGIQAYAGNLAHEMDRERRREGCLDTERKVRALKAALEKEGLPVKEVTGISTGTLEFHGADSVYTEVQTGSFVFGDRTYRDVGIPFEQSLYVLASVISARSGAIITDCGVKSLGMDQRAPVFADHPELPVEFSEEHTGLYFDHDCRVGDKLRIIPGHCCTTVNLFDRMYFYRGEKVIDCVPVTGRGKCL